MYFCCPLFFAVFDCWQPTHRRKHGATEQRASEATLLSLLPNTLLSRDISAKILRVLLVINGLFAAKWQTTSAVLSSLCGGSVLTADAGLVRDSMRGQASGGLPIKTPLVALSRLHSIFLHCSPLLLLYSSFSMHFLRAVRQSAS